MEGASSAMIRGGYADETAARVGAQSLSEGPTLVTAVTAIEERQSYATMLAERAEALAARLQGPVPESDDAKGAPIRPDMSVVDAIHSRIRSLEDPLGRLDRALQRISRGIGA